MTPNTPVWRKTERRKSSLILSMRNGHLYFLVSFMLTWHERSGSGRGCAHCAPAVAVPAARVAPTAPVAFALAPPVSAAEVALPALAGGVPGPAT